MSLDELRPTTAPDHQGCRTPLSTSPQAFRAAPGNRAPRSLSFELYEGEKLGLIGRNGSGKSTLTKLLAGIFSPSCGSLHWHRQAQVQLLSLGVGFEGSLTGRENAILNGMLLGHSRRTMLSRVEAIKEYSELGDFFELPVNTYSSGMNMRLGFSIAMQSNPDVLLLDELLGVGDASFQAKSEKTLREKFRGTRTVVLILHDPVPIVHLCTRAIGLHQGAVRAEVCGRDHCCLQRCSESLIPTLRGRISPGMN